MTDPADKPALTAERKKVLKSEKKLAPVSVDQAAFSCELAAMAIRNRLDLGVINIVIGRTTAESICYALDNAALLNESLRLAESYGEGRDQDAIAADVAQGECEHENEQLKAQVTSLLRERDALREGWVLVPREPTEAQLDAAWVAFGREDFDDLHYDIASAYRAMLAAAPPGESA